MRFAYHPLTSVAIAVGVWLSLLPLGALILPEAFRLSTLPLLGGSAVVGLTLALLRAPRPLTLAAQTIVICGILVWQGLTLSPKGPPVESLRLLTSDGVDSIRASLPPLEATPGIVWLTLLLAAVLVLVVELLVNGLEQPGWAIAPLALSFVMSALIVKQDLPWLLAVPVIAAYLMILLSAGRVNNATGRASRSAAFAASRLGTGLTLAALAVIVSLVVAPLIPLGPKQPWNNAGSDGPIQLSDPTVQLNNDLRRPEDVPVLTYRPSDGKPTYLRTVALPNLTVDGARLMPMRLSRFGLGTAYNYPGTNVKVEVEMADVPSEYLPAPFAPKGFNAEGAWSYDPDTLSIVASGADRINQTRRLTYSVEATLPEPSKEQIQAAQAGSGVDPVTLEVPVGVSDDVRALTDQVIGEASTAGDKALAIQSFLRSREFTYTLSAPSTAGTNAINAFLLDDRSGYCIHFAAAMITMARIEGIPSRMAVGFTPGERQEDGSYEVTAHDAHAWPELYLDGLGWVQFEPTPAFDGPPEYVDPAERPASPSAQPSSTASAKPTTTTTPSATPKPTQAPSPSPSEGGGALGLWLGLTALLVALLAVPAVTRVVQRAVRLRGGQGGASAVDGAWAEARATLLDYGWRLPGGSPGPAASTLGPDLPARAAATLASIAHEVELSRFSSAAPTATGLSGEVRALGQQLAGAASTGTRLRAVMLAPSLFGFRRPPTAVETDRLSVD